MPKSKLSSSAFRSRDISAWNFIIFLTLAFMLLVLVLSAMGSVTTSIRTRAGLTCPAVVLPKPEDCPGGSWTFKRVDSCPTFRCEPSVSPTKK